VAEVDYDRPSGGEYDIYEYQIYGYQRPNTHLPKVRATLPLCNFVNLKTENILTV